MVNRVVRNIGGILLTVSLALLMPGRAGAVPKCSDGDQAECRLNGKPGTQSCVNGKWSPCRVVEACPSPKTMCGAACVDLSSNAAHCGACGVACEGASCQGGKCTCPPDFIRCDGTCRRPTDDPLACGGCGKVCAGGRGCRNGSCGCADGLVDCGGSCRNLANDAANCGGCGKTCGADQVCERGACKAGPPPIAPMTPPPAPGKPLDLVWTRTDPNGLPLNPDWRARSSPDFGTADYYSTNDMYDPPAGQQCTSEKHVAHVPCVNPDRACPYRPRKLADGEGGFRDCDTREYTNDWGACSSIPIDYNWSGFCCGHVNFLSATFEGAIQLIDKSHWPAPWLGCVADPLESDINWNFFPTGGNALLGRDVLHCEHAATETLDRYESTWWKDFRNTIDSDPDPCGETKYVSHQAVMIGLVEFDSEHGIHTEVHPIYVLALRENPFNPEDDRWAIFARNIGDEGACGKHPRTLDLNQITLRLPAPSGTSTVLAVQEMPGTEFKGPGSVSPVRLVKDAAEITFYLGPPEQENHVNGELRLRWAVSSAAPKGEKPAPLVSRNTSKGVSEGPPGADLLTREQLTQLVSMAAAKLPAPVKPADAADAKRVSFTPPPARKAGDMSWARGRVLPDPPKSERERRIMTAVCEMLKANPKRPALCAQFDPPGPVAPSLNGVWGSNRGAVTITYTPGTEGGPSIHFKGKWDAGGGKTAEIDGAYDTVKRMITFRYVQPWNNVRGTAQLALGADGSLSGTFADDTGGGKGPWTMRR